MALLIEQGQGSHAFISHGPTYGTRSGQLECLYQAWSYLWRKVKVACTPPHLRHDPSHLKRWHCPTKVPSPLGCTDRRTHPLALKSPRQALRVASKLAPEKNGFSDSRTCFYNKFKEEVAEHNEDLQKKHNEDLNTTLIFVSFFLS